MATAHDPEGRRSEKFRLIKRLYEKRGRDDVRRLMRIIEWLVQLPKDMETKLQEDVQKLEQEKQMTYVPTYERAAWAEGVAKGIAEGLHEGIAFALKLKFGPAGARFLPQILSIDDVAVLRQILASIEQSKSVDELRLPGKV